MVVLYKDFVVFWCSGLQEEGEVFLSPWPSWFTILFHRLHSKLFLHSKPAESASPGVIFGKQFVSPQLRNGHSFSCHCREDREDQASSIPHHRRPCLSAGPCTRGVCRSPAAQEPDADPHGGLWNTQDQETRKDGRQCGECSSPAPFLLCDRDHDLQGPTDSGKGYLTRICSDQLASG